MKWCCLGFQSHYEAAGQQGHAILIGRDSMGKPEITMQYRAIDAGKELLIESEIPIATVMDIRIVFCPWCGRNGEEWYGDEVDSLYREGLKIAC
jgi:hypothetical protein